MPAILAECKLLLVVAAVLAVTLAAAQWRQTQDAPVYLPAEDPYLFGRACAPACKGPADEVAKVTVDPGDANP